MEKKTEKVMSMGDKLIGFSIKCMEAVYDCIESCVDSVTLAAGRNLLFTFYVSIVLLVMSIMFRALKFPAFISWQEASVCAAIAFAVCIADKTNRAAAGKLRDKFKKGADGDGGQ